MHFLKLRIHPPRCDVAVKVWQFHNFSTGHLFDAFPPHMSYSDHVRRVGCCVFLPQKNSPDGAFRGSGLATVAC
jgi:hypothetical protein